MFGYMLIKSSAFFLNHHLKSHLKSPVGDYHHCNILYVPVINSLITFCMFHWVITSLVTSCVFLWVITSLPCNIMYNKTNNFVECYWLQKITKQHIPKMKSDHIYNFMTHYTFIFSNILEHIIHYGSLLNQWKYK